jgi:hypothetical protein
MFSSERESAVGLGDLRVKHMDLVWLRVSGGIINNAKWISFWCFGFLSSSLLSWLSFSGLLSFLGGFFLSSNFLLDSGGFLGFLLFGLGLLNNGILSSLSFGFNGLLLLGFNFSFLGFNLLGFLGFSFSFNFGLDGLGWSSGFGLSWGSGLSGLSWSSSSGLSWGSGSDLSWGSSSDLSWGSELRCLDKSAS